MKKLYKNWTVHNIISHPLMAVALLLRMNRLADMIHDCTIPK
jgi:hypothetical protein